MRSSARCAPRRFRATRIATWTCNANYSGQTFKHILAPVWLLSYTYGAKAFQAVMNGFTGAIQGEYPKSWIKVTLLVVALVIIVLIALSLGTHR